MFSLTSLGLEPTTFKALFLSYFVLGLLLFILVMVFYFLKAVGIYNMATTVDSSFSSYAFIPFYRDLAFGNLSDTNRKGKRTAKRLLFFKIFKTAFCLVGLILFTIAFIDIVFKADDAIVLGKELSTNAFKQFLVPIIFISLSAFCYIIYRIIYLIALYNIFYYFAEGKRILYFILSIFLPFLTPIFLFIIRKNECIFDVNETTGEFVM